MGEIFPGEHCHTPWVTQPYQQILSRTNICKYTNSNTAQKSHYPPANHHAIHRFALIITLAGAQAIIKVSGH